MATVIQLKTDLEGFEDDVRKIFTRAPSDTQGRLVLSTFELGMSLALLAMKQEVLELTIQGSLPEGRAGAIMASIAEAIEASKGRVLNGRETEIMPGD